MKKPTSSPLTKLFSPASIAVVGASREERKLGTIVLRNIMQGGFTGKLFPINPQATTILDIPCYAKYADVPVVPDLAIIAIPAAYILNTLEDIARKGTKHLVILSAGFKEIGADGAKLEAELVRRAKKHGLTIIGPNCLGFTHPEHHLNATFAKTNLARGSTRFVLQSGALASSLFNWAESTDIGLGTCVTLGNKAVVNENDILEYWEHATPPLTPVEQDAAYAQGLSGLQPIGLYLESLSDGRRLVKTARRLAKYDPVFMLKPGRSAAAKRAMRSHTGSLAGDDTVLVEALHEAGIIRCKGFEDFFDLTRLATWEVPPGGPRVAVVSNAGGPAVVSADTIDHEGLELATLSDATHALLAAQLPSSASILNPVDVLGDAPALRYQAALEAVLAESTVDSVVVLLTPQVMTEIEATATTIVEVAKKFRKTVVCSFMGGTEMIGAEQVLNRFRIPSFRYPERAIWALGRMWWWQAWRTKQPVRSAHKIVLTPKKTEPTATTALHPRTTDALLKKIGLKIPPSLMGTNLPAAEKFLQKYQKIVLKVASTRLLHKRDTGGVVTGITTKTALRQAWKELEHQVAHLRATGDSDACFQVQQQIAGGIELIVGITRDANFGLVIMLGAGGTLVELLNDHNLHLLPMKPEEIHEFIKRSNLYPILTGYRGGSVYAVKKLEQLVVRLAEAMQTPDGKKLAELEINPVILTEKEAWAVDGKALFSQN